MDLFSQKLLDLRGKLFKFRVHFHLLYTQNLYIHVLSNNNMETLVDIKKDGRSILLEMKAIGDRGPTKENAIEMQKKMMELQKLIPRLDSLPNDA